MQNFQAIIIIWTRTYGQIFKSALVFLKSFQENRGWVQNKEYRLEAIRGNLFL